MATKPTKPSKGKTPSAGPSAGYRYCSALPAKPRSLAVDVDPNRAALIQRDRTKWVNGTTLHYYFFDKPKAWAVRASERAVIRKAFAAWKAVGIGLEFKEVQVVTEAEIRIGGLRGDGAWSYVGRDVLDIGSNKRTMNFGWDLTQTGEIDTAIHEIGHTLGFPHEHQNPISGIVWNEEAVYASLAAPPNQWDRAKTFSNIISKLPPDSVQGSKWDPDSIMHYPFEAGLITAPARYRNGLSPAPGLSSRDQQWVKKFYPGQSGPAEKLLKPFDSVRFSIGPGEQVNFLIRPDATRTYNFSTFGESDTVMVLFEKIDDEFRFAEGDDDSGENRNAAFEARLIRGREYRLRLRLYYSRNEGDTAVMMW